uniref:Vomeronasal type 2 receptor n=1 Tax=Plethodon shermani TaxID=263671 RepID=G9J5V9_9SALA|nr:vomeronasal type 2 receptor [Plethodon shermani]
MKFLHFVYAVEEINNRSDLLPNVTLGFHVFDSCQDGKQTMNGALGILTGRNRSSVNYNCYQDKCVIAIIENLPSALSMEMTNIFKMYNYPQLSQYLKKINFTNSADEEVFFDENGDYLLGYDVLNWLYSGNQSQRAIRVGRFDPSASPGKEFVINESLITWNTAFKQTPPLSRCSDPCLPGYRKLTSKDKQICCYTCILCPEGEISNHTDAEQCLQCLVHEWPNMKRDACIPKDIIYLSYQEPLGAVLAFIAFTFSVSTAIVLAIFIMFRDTPIVKANNRDLSYILLLSLMLCFLCSLLFIGQPQKVTCILRQAVFGIAFTVSVSSILGKTLTVVMAFYATKPGSNIRSWIKFGVGSYLVVFCSIIQSIICFIWLLIAPPYPSYDAQSVTGQMILECSEGSIMAFYYVLGYIGLLGFLCFIIAFLARNLPDSFNEAKFITFSMLVFCSVWIAFIPTYLSSKGKYMVAVEIFAILASSAGLLGCIFLPKCFVIILRPEMNTREHLSWK